MKKTKIICIVGPNTSDKNIMMELARNGMDVTHLNFSHGGYNKHQRHLELLKGVRKELDVPITALLDTEGPGIRTGQLKDGEKVALKEGQAYTLTTRELVGDDAIGYINYDGLNEDVAVDNRILINDGLIELEVRQTKDTDIVCGIINGGELGEKKGANVPSIKIKLPALTDKDKEDIRFGIRRGFDFIAASFICMADYIEEIETMLGEQGSSMKVIAKIENAEGIENLNAIVETADDITVTRGGMGAEIPAEKVPHIQKKTIRKYNKACKIVITATQMLDSMIHNPRPTRAEVTGVAGTVYDGTDAMILSGETIMGRYPVGTLRIMVSTALGTEMHLGYVGYYQRKVTEQNMRNVSNAARFASASTAHNLDAGVIIAPSITGFATQMLPEWGLGAGIIGMSPSMATVRQMQLQWDVALVWSHHAESADELIENSVEELKNGSLVRGSELAVIAARVVTYARRHETTTRANIMRVVNIE